MAGWLSSKLKEAEQFLHQIDQQAAESLGKPEKQKPSGTLEGRHGLRGKMKHNSDPLYANEKDVRRESSSRGKLESGSEPASSALSKLIKKPEQGPRALNGNARLNGNTRSEVKDSSSYKKKQLASILQAAEDSEGNVGRDDWTELLASPNVDPVASPALASSVGSSDSGRAGYLKGSSSRFTSNSNRNGGSRRQSGDIVSGNFSLAKPNTKDSTMNSKISPSASVSKIGSVDSSNMASARRFGDETLPRRLELDLARLVGVEAGGGITKGPSENTGRKGNDVDLTQAITRRLSDSEDSMHVSEGLVEEFAKEDGADETTLSEKQMVGPIKVWEQVGESSIPASECTDHFAELNESMASPIDNEYDNSRRSSQTSHLGEPGRALEDVFEGIDGLEKRTSSTQNLLGENGRSAVSDSHLAAEARELAVAYEVGQLEASLGTKALPVSLQSDEESYESSSMSDADSDGETDESEEDEEIERQKSAHKKRIARRNELTAIREAAAQAAIRQRELFVEKLEKEVITLKRVLAEREEQQGRQAAELRMSIAEVMHALETEKKLHSSTRMKALAEESQLENQNADLAKSLGALQWELEEQMSQVFKSRRMVEDKKAFKAELERRLAKIRGDKCPRQQNGEPKLAEKAKDEDCSFEEEQSDLWKKIQQCQIQVKDLEVKIHGLKDTHVPTETEKELENHLAQLTDHLIQKQAQVEALSTEKATLLIRLEALSNTIEEERVTASSQSSRNHLGGRRSLDWDSKYYDMEYGLGRCYGSKAKPFAYALGEFSATVGSMGSVPLSPVLRQMNGFVSAGMFYLRKHRWAQAFAVVYIIILHLWFWFVLFMNSKPTQMLALQEFGLPKNVSELKDGSNVTNLL